MPLLYHPNIYDRVQPIGSYWETTDTPVEADCPPLRQSQTCDVAIIGAGFTGLSAALHLARSGIQAAIVEAGVPGWGASGRNGGFCCAGATRLSNHALVKQFGVAETCRYYRDQREAVELVRQLAAAEAIEIEAQGDGEVQVAHHPSRLAELEAEYAFFTEIAGYPCCLWSQKELTEHGVYSPEAQAALHLGVGFGLNPVKYSRGLARAVMRRGVAIYAYSPVHTWEKDGAWHLLHTPGATLKAKRVIVATNGYTTDRLHSAFSDRLLPAISNILTTRPLTSAEQLAQGWHTETPVFDTRHLLFYYRLLKDGRFLFGSRGGTWGSPAERDRYRYWMIKRFRRMFPAWNGIEITHFWNGLVCLSAALVPHVGYLQDDPSIFYALAYHGNGVAMSTWSGRAVASLVADAASLNQLCAIVCQPIQRFPLPALRLWYLRSAYWFYSIRDHLP
jgi:glycine/D-amino acid oxidase-like deaminating enzyme